MAASMAERDLEGITRETGQRMTAGGRAVRRIRSTFLPGGSRRTCLFEAPNAEAVKELEERAEIPFTRIVEVLDLAP